MREPRTTKEHLISIYGHIEGLKKEIDRLSEENDNLRRMLDAS